MLRGKSDSFRLLQLCAIGIAIAHLVHASDPELSGSVRNENEVPVAGATITVRPAPPATGGPWQAQSDATGAFSITLPVPGDYLVDVQRQGYYELKDRPIHVETTQETMLVINTVREVFQSVNVNEQVSPVDISQTQNQERLSGTEINDVLYPNSHSLRDSMQMMPGVVLDPAGGLHFNGSSENQVQYVLNGFNIADPITGNFHTTLAVEGIRSLDYSSGRYSPQYDKGSAGVLAINTENGTDAFHYTATDFIPGLQLQQGVRLGNWYPRVGFSGPIVRGRAWFSDTFASEYTTSLITGLPSGQNTRSGWAGSNLLHTQINVTPRNILFADFLINLDNEGRYGLGVLDPVSTTVTLHTRQYFGSLKDQVYIGDHSIIEIGYAHNDFSDSQTPQGQSPYIFSTQGRSGNYFVTSTQGASRDEARLHGYAPPFRLAGSHQIEAGVDADFTRYNGDFHRTEYELIGLAGQLLSETFFTGPGTFGVHDTEAGAWVLDTWRVSKRFQIDAGLREDWDRLVQDMGWSPRVSFSWSPFAAGHTRVAGGYSITHDMVPLEPFGRVLDQSALTTSYNASGVPVGPPAPTAFAPGTGLKLPGATNWSLSADHEFSSHITANVTYLRRRGSDGFDFVNTLDPNAPPSVLPLPNGSAPGIYQLASMRRDDFDSFQVRVRQTLAGQYEWMASYTRSRAQSNAILDPNAFEPLQVLPYLIPMPWDTPNRFLGWAYFPVPIKRWRKNWAIAVLADARTGYPFSVQQQTGLVAGGVNSYRFPFHFDLNLAIERMVTLRGYRFALRGGVDNLTNQNNPTAVENVVGAPQFLQFLGYEGRHFVVRIRFFGRAGTK
ncbi:MAG TPA: TonB-dependent receptor [Bryobacteraceae bacterium]|nr:TonB-dependent receptor [Bryobacteraceae bacterium]